MKIHDESIEEIRSIRKSISQEFNHDVRNLAQHYQQLQVKYQNSKEPKVQHKSVINEKLIYAEV